MGPDLLKRQSLNWPNNGKNMETTIGIIKGLGFRDNGKENGNYFMGDRYIYICVYIGVITGIAEKRMEMETTM